jgi:5-methylthioribose kinase
LLANFLLSYVSQPAHRSPGDDYDEWILQQILVFWSTFVEQFWALWNDPAEHTGFKYGTLKKHPRCDNDCECVWKGQQHHYVATLLTDTIGFAGMKMLRRIVGIAHVEDLECIADAEQRSHCERRALRIARRFIVEAASFHSMEDVVDCARTTK